MKEMLDVLTEYGEFTGTVASREECHKNGYCIEPCMVL